MEAFLVSSFVEFFFSEKTKNNPSTNVTNPRIDDVGCELENFFDKNISDSLEITDIKKKFF